MKRREVVGRPLLALLALGYAGCGGETTHTETIRETTIIREVPADAGPTNPPPVETGLDCTKPVYTAQPSIEARTAATGKAVITVAGLQFKDVSGDGQLQPYEDWRLPELCRARDLVARMNTAQKVGLMSEGGTLGSGTADGVIPAANAARITDQHVRQALVRFGSRTAKELAVYINNLNELAEKQPLGIPVVMTADPIHGFGMSTNATTGVQTINPSSVVSAWPYPMGLGAANDEALTKLYGDTVRREFMAMGFRWQLGPMADLATEPRWARVQNTFGDFPLHVAKHSRACVEGFQGGATGDLRNGIAATIKHFPGAGPAEGGMDSHTFHGRYNVFPGNNLASHLVPFKAVFDVRPAAMMACYSIFKNQYQWDPMQIPSGFSRGFVTELAKEELGFDGMVTGDWGTATGSAWGLGSLSTAERGALWLKAGSHQFGSDPASYFQAAYDQKLIGDAEINGAAEKILEMSFKLGIFEDPYVDPEQTNAEVASPANKQAGFDAQKRAIVMLRNIGAPLPISGTRAAADANADGTVAVYFDGVTDALNGDDGLNDVLGAYDYRSAGAPTATPAVMPVTHATTLATADIAVLRITARKGTYFGLDKGVPLSFDAPFGGLMADSNAAAAIKDRNRVIDALRVRDGYRDSTGAAIAAANPKLKIVLVMHMDRPGIVKPFIHGLTTLDETAGVPGSYPSVSTEANIRPVAPANNATVPAAGGVDALLVEFGAFDRAVLDVLFNKNLPAGVTNYGLARLPVEIPSSDAEVDKQFEDVSSDTRFPTFPAGSGTTL